MNHHNLGNSDIKLSEIGLDGHNPKRLACLISHQSANRKKDPQHHAADPILDTMLLSSAMARVARQAPGQPGQFRHRWHPLPNKPLQVRL